MKILHVVGARPNFMKAAPVMKALFKKNIQEQVLLHTGQHYDQNMSRVFFHELELPEPSINLEVGSGTQAVQTANIMVRFEKVVQKKTPDIVLIYGDVNSTIAAAIVCAKLRIAVGHVEAGLRSFDRTMPEEINRIVTDRISDTLFTPSVDADDNLIREGIDRNRIHLVGNIMIDTLSLLLPKARQCWEEARLRNIADKKDYFLVTLHRPSNVDNPEVLSSIVKTLVSLSKQKQIIFPVHPRTKHRIHEMGIACNTKGLKLLNPLGYLDFLALQTEAVALITDSGGIQEETTYLGIPCLTVRTNTERPVTVTLGTNTLVGQDMNLLQTEAIRILKGNKKQGKIPPLWDGSAGKRIADIIMNL